MEYILSVEASQDIENILDYFLQRNIDAGEKFVKDFNNKCLNIVKFPKIGRSGYRDIESLFLDLDQ
jgi:toxin ParE1/3/4